MPAFCHFYGMSPDEFRALKMADFYLLKAALPNGS